MTVKEIDQHQVHCQWFLNGKVESNRFDKVEIILAPTVADY